ncbi:MAG: UDP-N-acetylmuramate dehydrogenase, partial [Gammaproteobacteria bacterium]
MEGIRGEIRYHESTVGHTTWRAGGPLRRWFKPADLDDLCLFLAQCEPDEPLLWLGLGSNLLVRDGGFAGTAIATYGGLAHMSLLPGNQVHAQAGVACNKLARFGARNHLVGGAFFAGIPGTVGGALAMNAGAFGGETWQRVVAVETVDRQGVVRSRQPDEFRVAYRKVTSDRDEFFVAARFQFEAGDGEKALSDIRALLERRNRTQPTGLPSCGSVFRNPEGDHAARLIEASGLKGKRIGDAA